MRPEASTRRLHKAKKIKKNIKNKKRTNTKVFL
jgi:hypothetical protein